MESAVHLHQPEAGFDADLTLDRGRIYLSNHQTKGAVKVRLRFAGEVWDLTLLDPDTEVGVDLIQAYLGDVNYLDEAPFRSVDLFVFSGRAGVKFDDARIREPAAARPHPVGQQRAGRRRTASPSPRRIGRWSRPSGARRRRTAPTRRSATRSP